MGQRIELIAIGGVEHFRVVECEPQKPDRTEIRIRQDAAGVNYIDIYQRTGLYPVPLPAVLGVEGAGIVEAVGDDVAHIRVGDRVAYTGLTGGYASTRLLPAWRAIKLPEDIETKAAASAILRGLTTHMLLKRTFQAESGKVILVHAAAGGLGTILVRWAKALGCTVIGTVGSSQKEEIAVASGADHVILGRDADIAAEVSRLTAGRGVDYVIDGIGGDVLRKSLACVRKFGIVASIGQAAGPIPAISVEELGPIRSLSLARPSVMAYAAEQDIYSTAGQSVIEAIRQGIIPKSSNEYSLKDAARAHSDLEDGKTTGSITLIM